MARAFTLLELVFVIALIAIVAALGAGRFEPVLIWKQKGDIRKFVNTWEFLAAEASGRREAYRLVIDFNKNSYHVLREVVVRGNVTRNVDHLKNLRTKSEQERRSQKELEDLLSVEEELEEDEARQNLPLDILYYEDLYRDPNSNLRLAQPLEFPSLVEPRSLAAGLSFRSLKTERGKTDSGTAFIRFSPRGASEFAVVYFSLDGEPITAMMNPSTGKVKVEEGELEFEWTWGKKKE